MVRDEWEHPQAILFIDAEANRKNLSGIAPARVSRRLAATQAVSTPPLRPRGGGQGGLEPHAVPH